MLANIILPLVVAQAAARKGRRALLTTFTAVIVACRRLTRRFTCQIFAICALHSEGVRMCGGIVAARGIATRLVTARRVTALRSTTLRSTALLATVAARITLPLIVARGKKQRGAKQNANKHHDKPYFLFHVIPPKTKKCVAKPRTEKRMAPRCCHTIAFRCFTTSIRKRSIRFYHSKHVSRCKSLCDCVARLFYHNNLVL